MKNIRVQGTPLPDLRASGGFAPIPPLVSGGWGLRHQISKHSPPLIANFWLRAWTGGPLIDPPSII